jgi:hypothetical protein
MPRWFLVVLVLVVAVVVASVVVANRSSSEEVAWIPGIGAIGATSREAVAADGENAGLEVAQESRARRSPRKIVGVWKGEVEPAYFKFCFRQDGTGFMSAGNWAGAETLTFSWQDVGGQLSLQGKNIGGHDQNSVNWKYEWMGDNLIIHLIEDSEVFPVILTRIPEVAE